MQPLKSARWNNAHAKQAPHPRPLSWLLLQRAADRGLLRRDGLAAAGLLNFPLVDYLDLLGEACGVSLLSGCRSYTAAYACTPGVGDVGPGEAQRVILNWVNE